jgi:hypothetical protein
MLRTIDVKRTALDVAKDPTSSPTDRRNARQAVARIKFTLAHQAKIGRKPSRNNFSNDAEYLDAVDAYRSVLDRLATEKECGRILDSRDSSPLQRHNARKKLEALNGPPPDDVQSESDEKNPVDFPRREDFGWSGRGGKDWTEFVTNGGEEKFQAALTKWRETAPPIDPQVAAFLNALNEDSVRVKQPAAQPSTPKAPDAAPIDPTLFCERHVAPLCVCRCDQVMCSLCLHPKSKCYPPCQNSRR